MARGWSTDYLQAFPFWLVDVAPLGLLSLPVLNPFMGFSTISGPEVVLNVETISEANWIFDKKVVTGASVGPITMERGVTWFDSDFWHWVMATLKGDPEEFTAGIVPGMRTGGVTPRRTMMLIHFFTRMLSSPFNRNADVHGVAARAALLGAGAAAGGGGVLGGISAAGSLTVAAGLGAVTGMPFFEFAPRIPAKVYILYGCVPSNWKVDGDFDATSGDVSISSLEMTVEMVEHKSFEF